MKKISNKMLCCINLLIGAMITLLGFTSCEQRIKYGVPVDLEIVDTTVHTMYGVPTDIDEPFSTQPTDSIQ